MSYYFSHEGLTDSYRTKGSDAEVSELDLFSSVSLQSSIDNAYYEVVYSNVGNLETTVPDVTFIAKGQNNLIDLNESYMEMVCQLLKKDGTSGKIPADTEIVNATDLTMYTLFSYLVLSINGRQVNNSFHLYHLQCYLQLLTNMSPESLDKWRIAGYWGDANLTQVI